MNVLFVFYGDASSNSAIPLALHVRELQARGHQCVVAVPAHGDKRWADPAFDAVPADVVLDRPGVAFSDGRPADVIHAWTPREVVRRFVTRYQAWHPTPWVIYHEDNERWIAEQALAMVGMPHDALLQHPEAVISTWTPESLPHLLRYGAFIGLADAAVVIQGKLAVDVPPWVPWTEVMPGTDLERFSPREPDPALRGRYGVVNQERVIVYPGGLNDFTRPGLESLCRAVGLINARGTPCRLLRSGQVPLDFLDRLPPEASGAVTDLGPLDREALPALLALADVFVQPGKHDAFEDLRLPGKLPEFFAMGRPVVLPDTNIAHLLQDGVDAVIHRTGTAEEIADKCMALFADPERARRIGEAGRRFAEANFAPAVQAAKLEAVYRGACEAFDARVAVNVWTSDAEHIPVPALLVRRLRALAKRQRGTTISATAMLDAHAACIESALDRATALEVGMAHRDTEIAKLKQAWVRAVADRDRAIADIKASLSWRLTRPLRMIAERLLQLTSRTRR